MLETVEKVNLMKGVGIKSNEGDIRRKGSKHPCHRESRMRPWLVCVTTNIFRGR